VPTKRLNEQVKRNAQRFPEDFVFHLTEEEAEALRSQFATSKKGRGGRRYRPYAFTEDGAIMAANVLFQSAPLDDRTVGGRGSCRAGMTQRIMTHGRASRRRAGCVVHDRFGWEGRAPARP